MFLGRLFKKKNDDLTFKNLGILEINEGDTIVLRTNKTLSEIQISQLKKVWNEANLDFPKDKYKIIVLDNMDIGVIRKVKEE